ncbi:tRNA uracil 4-sulfurtransferase ThiI [Brevibacillus centrosporus]|uniref:Probable tRNA sulfurtransferase n=1 Tax=Brevibacillus centrosporus TaxID=54910 RepID=A0A1I3W052_9BACL|nr:tRNA uracil 4-sulfurtransferase ThiI [Brevibacillus centrosporus]MEC2130616.1 tRNA 4-thiouridine(8) synthase ThiI [Brevibacillus centrosporus]MED4908293.1 tRNA 4-thiouridine(8) synthase ThiI [Brevibacillus centrosporus]RNB69339.1 tRNA 4-thiouridine(8) synthase ThiI [Brevibacillus centrosporus]SFK00855.1 thiamine biosynthesis protein ThiI [Brevibacillus centrosporus]GED34730.1 putative tRNA sulfurtransferase [Brevibacillus centrosporus]
MNYDVILIRYGELALKGKNRDMFEETLVRSVKSVLRSFFKIKVRRNYGRMYVELHGEDAYEVMERLKRVFGISSFSPTIQVDPDIDTIKERALELIRQMNPEPRNFRVVTRRADKRYPIPSMEVNRIVGTHILRALPKIKVDVHEPEAIVNIEIRTEGTYISCETIPGPGGLPVGVSGKVLLLLSGGIDSPVAGWMMMKRGVTLEAIHFHSYPYTSERSLEKVRDLAQKLTKWGGTIRLHVVPFTEIQTAIREKCPEDYLITIMRRFMMRISEKVAANTKALALASGESLGQVASQTLESMDAINKVISIPMLRPLVAMDKIEITDISRKIDTYDLSILPYEDCCTVFTPKNPVTRPKVRLAEKFETALDVDALVEDAVNRTVVEEITTKPREVVSDLF